MGTAWLPVTARGSRVAPVEADGDIDGGCVRFCICCGDAAGWVCGNICGSGDCCCCTCCGVAPCGESVIVTPGGAPLGRDVVCAPGCIAPHSASRAVGVTAGRGAVATELLPEELLPELWTRTCVGTNILRPAALRFSNSLYAADGLTCGRRLSSNVSQVQSAKRSSTYSWARTPQHAYSSSC